MMDTRANSGTATLPLPLRPAGPADAAAVVDLLRQLIATLAIAPQQALALHRHLDADIGAALRASSCRIFVASSEPEGAPVALARADILQHEPLFRLRAPYRCGYVDQMFVQRAWRRRGLGSALLAACERWFVAQKVTHCLLHAAPAADPFYQAKGYHSTGQLVRALPP